MAEWLLLAFYVQVPVVIGGVLHMLAVSRDWWLALKVPVNARLFGANKTWRGFMLMPLFTALGAAALWPLEQWLGARAVFGPWLLAAGFCAGLAYVLAELPNSLASALPRAPRLNGSACCSSPSTSSTPASVSRWPMRCCRGCHLSSACCMR